MNMKNIYLFPCGHIFDANCLVKILIDNMMDLLKELQEDYPKNVNVKER